MPRTTANVCLATVVMLAVSMFSISPLAAQPPALMFSHAQPLLGTYCPSLPPPSGTIVDVSTVVQLLDAVSNAVSNTTIRVADGDYHLAGQVLQLDVPHVTLRSASGDRGTVTLDGD